MGLIKRNNIETAYDVVCLSHWTKDTDSIYNEMTRQYMTINAKSERAVRKIVRKKYGPRLNIISITQK